MRPEGLQQNLLQFRRWGTSSRVMDLSSLQTRLPGLNQAVNLIREAGGDPFLVGGSVRDLLLGEIPEEIDVEVFGITHDALQSALKKSFHVDFVGRSFGVFKLKGHPIDISLPRTERLKGNKHTDFEVTVDPFLSLEEAARRRDFTFNSIYLRLKDQEIVDPLNGTADLKQRILRHSSAQFSEDALRVYRAMQFIARFDLSCAPETLELCRSMDPHHLPKERIFEEFKKLLLKGISISKGLQFLADCGWISQFPELEQLIGCEQDAKWHPEGDVWIHTLLAMDAFAQRRSGDKDENLLVGLGVLCHDMGKPETSYQDKDGRIRSPRHDVEGVKHALQFLSRLTNEKRLL